MVGISEVSQRKTSLKGGGSNLKARETCRTREESMCCSHPPKPAPQLYEFEIGAVRCFSGFRRPVATSAPPFSCHRGASA